jgi:MYXO-CTERM domain-containing protein
VGPALSSTLLRMRATLLLTALGFVLSPRAADAQRIVAQDTLSTSTPAAITCGFCEGERYGVIFRELDAGGLRPADFPLTIRSLRVAIASARVTGSAPSFDCEGLTVAGNALADLELWAGSEPPSDLSGVGAEDPWTTGEELLWAAADVPLMKSTADADGSPMIEAGFNELQPVDEMEEPIRVGADIRYIRAVVRIQAGLAGSSASCDAVGQEPPSVFPLRDNDGVITDERSFIYANGPGWLWNEDAGIDGDWAIRLEVRSDGSPDSDAGPSTSDGGLDVDGGSATDGGSALDAAATDGGSTSAGGGGCSCQVAPAPTAAWPALLVLGWLRRRVSGGCR